MLTQEEQNQLDKMFLEELEALAKKRVSPKNYRGLMEAYKIAESADDPDKVKKGAILIYIMQEQREIKIPNLSLKEICARCKCLYNVPGS